jgi:hypothetical protein
MRLFPFKRADLARQSITLLRTKQALGGAGRARILTVILGVLCILFGLIGMIRAVTAT